MPEQITKLRPDRDLQCYCLSPSAIAAMSGATMNGFSLSGKWRQQFDWAVVEWTRDNTFEHPTLRYLPDGDLSGLVLSYQEERSGCIPIESNLVPVVDWNNLRIWATDDQGSENLYHVNLWPSCAVAVSGDYKPASATMTLTGSPGVGNRVGLALLETHHYYIVQPGESLSRIAQGIAADISSNLDFTATSNNNSVTVTWKAGPNYGTLLGANGNRITVYGFAENCETCWQSPSASFDSGQFPAVYRIVIDFGALKRDQGIPTDRVRKVRWTWAADLQPGSFQQTEFHVAISNWTVSGNNLLHHFAGPGSRRIEDTDASITYSGDWQQQTGNYSGSRIHFTSQEGASCSLAYEENAQHDLYLGTRLLPDGARISLSIDGRALPPILLAVPGEDVLIRKKLGTLSPGPHTVTLTHLGLDSATLFFDFFEIVHSCTTIPDFEPQKQLALATDWDTYHSQSLPAERTAWLINKLGFQGRVNHYVGAIWFYELTRPGTKYASLSLSISGQPVTGSPTVSIDMASAQGAPATRISHLVLPDDNVANVAQALAALINLGTNLLWAQANGNRLTLIAREMGSAGNEIFVQASSTDSGYSFTVPSNTLAGGIDGTPYSLDTTDPLNATLIATAQYWSTDLSATPRINRAARDWHQAFFAALKSYGIDAVAAFSTELMNGDPSLQAGIAQRYPDGTPAVLNTPAIQTNFSPVALAFWQQVYLDMAQLQSNAGMAPYLQSGEVQWWYFPKKNVGMPFYDTYAQQQFQARYGKSMRVIVDNTADPTDYPEESEFLPWLIESYTATIREALRSKFPGARYEVLYPTDTNNTPLNQVINFPANDWTPQNLDCLKTESFSFTGGLNLDLCLYSMNVSHAKGFASAGRSHLIGIGDALTPWMKEVDFAEAQGLESIVLFALDQYCLIGYPAAPYGKSGRTQLQG